MSIDVGHVVFLFACLLYVYGGVCVVLLLCVALRSTASPALRVLRCVPCAACPALRPCVALLLLLCCVC